MTRAGEDRLRRAFDEVLDLPEEERPAFVRRRYAAEEDLRDLLLGMLDPPDAADLFRPLGADEVARIVASPPPASDPSLPEEVVEGLLVGGRYELGPRLGTGGAGVVHRATDRITGDPVAVKVLPRGGGGPQADARREASTLRLLRLPGVVGLIDDGVLDGRPYLVTELVDGRPFPGRPGAHAWVEIERQTRALLETLERVHRAGIVHADLKPANVLVGADGVPVVLDLGIARPVREDAARATGWNPLGTPGYMAPEQAAGESVLPRSDLYAVGVMLREALTGRRYRPSATRDVARLGFRLQRTGVDRRAPEAVEAPERVRRLLASLLQTDPAARPASAAEALAALVGEGGSGRRPLPFVGREAELEAVLRAARAGEAVAIEGPVGSGRTRLLQEAAGCLAEEGVPRPSPATGAGARRIALGPLREEELRGLFHGPDVLLHLREDGARELWRRTGGWPGLLAAELDAWSRAGLGWWEERLYTVRRSDLARLAHDSRPLAVPPPPASSPSLDEADQVLLAAAELAGGAATATVLARIGGSEAEARVERLLGRGLLADTGNGVLRPTALRESVRDRIGREAAALHGAIADALPPGDGRQGLHLAAAGRTEEALPAIAGAARTRLRDGDVHEAQALLAPALAGLGGTPPTDAVYRLLELHLQVAILLGRRGAFDEHLHVLGRFAPTPRLDQLERTARAAIHGQDAEEERALAEAPAYEDAWSDDGLRAIIAVRMYAAHRLAGEPLDRERERLEAFAARSGIALAHAAAAGARGWAAYRAGRHEEAARHYLAAADRTPFRITRATILQNAAAAFLSTDDPGRAEPLAREALALAQARRMPMLELRARTCLRSVRYRRGEDLEPDLTFALAARGVGTPGVTASAELQEAAFAWRRGRNALARELARSAARDLPGRGSSGSRSVARALALAATDDPDPEEARALLAEVAAIDPGYALQAAALVAGSLPALTGEARSRVGPLRSGWPVRRRRLRLHVLSLEEVERRLNLAPDEIQRS